MSQNEQKLLQRIAQLEAEVKNREEDLATYRRELSQANERLQSLMASLSRDLKVAAKIHFRLKYAEDSKMSECVVWHHRCYDDSCNISGRSKHNSEYLRNP